MATYTKFAVASDGRLVYRETGNVVPLKRGYTIKNKTVYNKSGRKVGQLGKGTKAQQKQIEKKAQTRVKKAENLRKKQLQFEHYEGVGGGAHDDTHHLPTKEEWREWADKYHDYMSMDLEYKIKVRTDDVKAQNFARTLERMVEEGYLDSEGASVLWESYKKSNDTERSRLWEHTLGVFEKEGYKPSG